MKNYYHKKPSKSITYLDMNHFYGWAMSDYLPYGEFKWLKNANNLDVNSISEKSPIGYIVEVGLNILVNYMYCKIIVHQLQKNIITNTMLCCQNIEKKCTGMWNKSW